MRLRLLTSAMLIALVAVLALGVPLGVVASRQVRDDARTGIEREARAIVTLVEEAAERGLPVPSARVVQIARTHTVRIVAARGAAAQIGPVLRGGILRATSPVALGGTVEVTASAGESDHDVREVWGQVGLLALAAFAVATGLALWQARRLAAPLEALAAASAHLGRAGFALRSGRHNVREVDALAQALQRRAEQIVSLLEHERAFSSNVAHQLRTPLTALSMRLEELAASETPATRVEAEAALEQADRLARTIDDLLALAQHGRPGDLRDVDVAMLVRDRVGAWQPIYRRSRRTLRLDEGGGQVVANTTPGAVEQALDVLFENALVHGAGVVTAGVRLASDHTAISVADGGTGIPDEARLTIFEGQARDSGLGLPLARTLVEACGGRLLLVASTPTVFEIRLPRVAPAPAVEQAETR